MKTVSPVKGIMYVIRTLKEPMAEAVNETDAWLPMWNDMGMMVCPVLTSTPQQNLKNRSMGRQR